MGYFALGRCFFTLRLKDFKQCTMTTFTGKLFYLVIYFVLTKLCQQKNSQNI